MNKSYHEMTDDEVRQVVKRICFTSSTEDMVLRRIKEELHYDGTPDITSSSISRDGMTMVQFMVLMFGPSGEPLSI